MNEGPGPVRFYRRFTLSPSGNLDDARLAGEGGKLITRAQNLAHAERRPASRAAHLILNKGR